MAFGAKVVLFKMDKVPSLGEYNPVCQVTLVILHGVVSPESPDTRCRANLEHTSQSKQDSGLGVSQ